MATPNDYFILTDDDKGGLATKVHELLETGCELVGGVSMAYDPEEKKMYYAQAMIDKRANDNDELRG